jgi:K+-sensing histidine kinase KdpD
VLSIGFFDYFFTEPRYTLYFTRSDIPYLIVFISFTSLVAWFSAVRRRVEGELRQARDDLQVEAVERTQQASLLT